MMGDQDTRNLTNAFRTVTLSRKRALQLIGGVMAVAVPSRVPPAAEAGKHRKPPLAVASVVVVDVLPSNSTTLAWFFQGVVVHKESGDRVRLDETAALVQTLTTDQARKQLVSAAQTRAVEALQAQLGLTVSKDRIAVTLL
jgi:hypothetical protein